MCQALERKIEKTTKGTRKIESLFSVFVDIYLSLDLFCFLLVYHFSIPFSFGHTHTDTHNTRTLSTHTHCCRVDKLSAHDVITVRRLLDYVYSKIEPKAGLAEQITDGSDLFEMLCQDQVCTY